MKRTAVKFNEELDPEEFDRFTDFLAFLTHKREGKPIPIKYQSFEQIKKQLIDTPQTIDFVEAVKSEMAHQQGRWGDESGEAPHHFQTIISYLNGKLIEAIWKRDIDKFKHHIITIAAVAGTAKKYLDETTSKTFEWFNKK